MKGMVKMMKAHDERMKQVYTVGELGEIKWIGWMNREDADGDCLFTPQTTYIRIEDNQGQFFKVYSSGQSMFECEITERSMWIGLFLNRLMSSLGILPEGKWIGLNWSVSDAVNYCRHHMEQREKEIISGGYFQNYYIF